MNRAAFYEEIRESLFSGSLNQGQVSGTEDVLDVWDRLYPSEDFRWLAYILATIYHETGKRMAPVREGFASTDEGAIAAVTKLFNEGRISSNYAVLVNGVSYFGRGRVQTTHLQNYQKIEQRFHQPFVADPGLLLSRPDIDAEVAVTGHIEGIWTGHKLAEFIGPGRCDFEQARTIVNGHDRASDIANYAVKFESAIQAGLSTKPATVPTKPIPPTSARGPTAVPNPASPPPSTPSPSPTPDLTTLLSLVQQVIVAVQGIRQQPGAAATQAPTTDAVLSMIQSLLGGALKSGQLGQVNGALGQTIGQFLDGKKSAIGIIGSMLTAMVHFAPDGSALDLTKMIPALAGLSGLGGPLLPIFLAMTAWGILGKAEKWSGASPTTPPAK